MPELVRIASGIDQLDDLLGGLFIGDNVVWHDDAGSLASTFCREFMAQSRVEQKPIIYVSFDRSPKSLLGHLGPLANNPLLTILDCFTDGKGASSPVFLKFYRNRQTETGCRVIRVADPGDRAAFNDTLYNLHATMKGDVRLVFESLTGMQEIWGGEDQLISFYSHSCPRLYELETVAFWVMEKNAHSARLKALITQVAQVVIELSIRRGTTSLTILKAEKRDTENIQKPYIYWIKGRNVTFDLARRTTGGLDLGSRVKDLRLKRGISQTDLARLVGVTPSTISQVESNLIYPSLPALLKMAEVLKVEVGSFFKSSGRVADRIVFPAEEARPIRLPALPDKAVQTLRLTPVDLESKVEPYLIEMNPGESIPGPFFIHRGEEFGYLISGGLEMKIGKKVYAVESGSVVTLTGEAPSAWKNPGPEPARLLWLKIG